MPPARSLAGDAEDATATARSNCGGEVVTGRWAPADDGGVRKSRDGRGSGAAAEGRQVGPVQRSPATAKNSSFWPSGDGRFYREIVYLMTYE